MHTTMIGERMDRAPWDAQHLARLYFDWYTIDCPGGDPFQSVVHFLIRIVTVCWRREFCPSRDGQLEDRCTTVRLSTCDQEPDLDHAYMDRLLGRI